MDDALGGKDPGGFPHPLLQRNLSNFAGPRFRSLLKGGEFYWAEHRVGDTQVLPGMVALEMARAALEQARGGQVLTAGLVFEDLLWSRPVRATKAPVPLGSPSRSTAARGRR
jgi:hypothetical protein